MLCIGPPPFLMRLESQPTEMHLPTQYHTSASANLAKITLHRQAQKLIAQVILDYIKLTTPPSHYLPIPPISVNVAGQINIPSIMNPILLQDWLVI